MIKSSLAAILSCAALTGSLSAQFASATNYVGNSPPKIDAGDLNGDGFIDLITGSDATPMCYGYLNSGTGTFGAPITVGMPNLPRDVKIADFDGANGLDLVTVISDTQIAVRLSSGAFPAFSGPVVYSVSSVAIEVEVADLDLDGDTDIAVLSQDSPGEITLYFNDGTGAFGGTPVIVALTQAPLCFTLGNVSSRDSFDLIYGTALNQIGVIVNTETSPLTYASELLFDCGNRPTAVTTGDLNGDGYRDIAVANGGQGVACSILLNQGGCVVGWPDVVDFDPYVPYIIPGTSNQKFGIVAEDFDCDGDLDVALANRIDALVAVLFNDGVGTFGSPAVHATALNCSDIVAANFDGALPDVATPNSTDISVLLNNSAFAECEHVFVGGIRDSFVNPLPNTVENACPGPELTTLLSSWTLGDFDDPADDRFIAHTFTGLPGNILSASLEIRARVNGGLASNDAFNIGLDEVCGYVGWGRRWTDLTGLPWTGSDSATVTLDLEELEGGIDLMRKIQADGRFDFYVQDDTQVDYAKLTLVTCGPNRRPFEALDHDPYVLGQPVTWTCTAQPGAVVLFYISAAVGPGPLLPPWGGWCLVSPAFLGWGAESGGVATFSLPSFPFIPPCTTLSTHALHVELSPLQVRWSNTMTQQTFQ